MANLTPTNVKIGQAQLTGRFATDEMRLISANTHLEIIKLTQFMAPNYQELRLREDRSIEVSLLTRQKRTPTTGRTSFHTGDRGDSATTVPSWDISADTFSSSMKQLHMNTFTPQQMFSNQLENAYLNMVEAHEGNAQDFLFAESTGVNVSTGGGGTFDPVDNTYNFAQANIDTVIQKTKTVMEENGYTGAITIFADSIAYDLFKYQAFQGAGNDKNLSFQHEGINFVRSIGYASKFLPLIGTYTTGVWSAVPNGAIGAMPHIPKDNRDGKVTRLQTYGSGISPYDQTPYAIHYYETMGDYSGLNGQTQDEATQFEISQDMAYMTSEITVVDETVVYTFSLQA
jgi:hypothetical protein